MNEDDGISITEPVEQIATTEIQTQNEESNEIIDSEVGLEQPDEQVEQHEAETSEIAPQVREDDPASVKKRINKMYTDKKQAEARAQQAEAQNLAYRAELARINQGQPQSVQAKSDGFPPPPDENDPRYENNPKALIKDCVNYERARFMHEIKVQQQQNYHTTLESKYNSQCDDARGKYGDFDQKLDSLGSIPVDNTPQSMEVITAIKELDNSGEVVYYYANNHAAFTKLFNLPIRLAAIELGKLSGKLGDPVPQSRQNVPPPKNLKGSGVHHTRKHINDLTIDEIDQMIRSPK